MVCVNVDTGTVIVSSEQTQLCSNYVLLNATEYQAAMSSGILPPMTASEGAEISGAILLIWALAWGIAQLSTVLKSNMNR